ncbi:MAG: MGMT family protein [Sediminibacterium sp.]|nr:MGMT family protein [Sediminibacterium sp.]
MKKKQFSIRSEDFFEQVYNIVRKIPFGRVTTYSAIATYLAAKQSARLVGTALHHSSYIFPPIPAHRVVNSHGVLSGKLSFTTPTLMAELLTKEGINIINDKVMNFQKIFWNPESLDN